MRRKLAMASLALACSGLLGCGDDSRPRPVEEPVAGCANPVRGTRYGVCGRLTTAPVGAAGARYATRGSVDAQRPAPVAGTTYIIEGGTLHVAH